jgi:segregation and condensation protein A
MSMEENFEEGAERVVPEKGEVFQLDIAGYEGPIDVLLQLARDQKVDLVNISILELADQYLAFVREARSLRLELRADYLVMAAWLAYLKSRLLLPTPTVEEEPSGAEMAAALRYQLQRLQAMRDVAEKLLDRPRLGRDFFARGQGEPIEIRFNDTYEVSLYELLKAYSRHKVRVEARSLRIQPMNLYSVEESIRRLQSMLGQFPGWRSLASFLPPDLETGLMTRSALAATFAASLEMCRQGKIKIRQDGTFGAIYLRPIENEASEEA